MKTESLNELREAANMLAYTATDLSNAKEDILNALEHIRAAIFMETPAPGGKFNLRDFCADDPIRPVMCGVFHDGGFKVACDSRILAACKESYETEKEGAIIGKDGRAIEGKYPKWRSVIPYNEESERHEIDSAKVYEILKREKAENRLVGKHGVKTIAIVRVGETFFKAELLAKVCRFMDHYGITALRTYGRLRAAKTTAGDGSLAILMPVVTATVPVERDGRIYSEEAELSKVWDDESYKFLRLSL